VKNLLSQYRKQGAAVRLLAFGWLALMLLLPFHAFISTWGGSTIGPLSAWKAWKDILLASLVLLAIVQAFIDPEMFRQIWKYWITKLIFVYGLLHVAVALFVGNQTEPLLLGLSINLRMLSIFLVAEVVFYYIKVTKQDLTKVLLAPAVVVVGFGLLQVLFLPYDFLRHFGYMEGITIAPFNTIDQQLDQLRIMSTLRGPNPLGSYLILPGVVILSFVIGFMVRFYKNKTRKRASNLLFATCSLLATLVVLYGSHSRSAWLGFVIACGVCVLLTVSSKWRLVLIGLGIAGLLVGSAGLYQMRESSFVQNVILHDNPDVGPSQTSNSDHLLALKDAAQDIGERPLTGCGPGCAGPASFYDSDGAKLSENYYLQVGQEVGVIGIGLFCAIILLVGRELFKQRSNSLALALFASLVGISVANMLLHVWADDTLAYVWWGLAGAVIATSKFNIIKKRS